MELNQFNDDMDFDKVLQSRDYDDIKAYASNGLSSTQRSFKDSTNKGQTVGYGPTEEEVCIFLTNTYRTYQNRCKNYYIK